MRLLLKERHASIRRDLRQQIDSRQIGARRNYVSGAIAIRPRVQTGSRQRPHPGSTCQTPSAVWTKPYDLAVAALPKTSGW